MLSRPLYRQTRSADLKRQCAPWRDATGPAVAAFLAAVLLALAHPVRGQSPCPNPPPVTLSPTIPTEVCIPTGFPGNPIAFFDDFSWRSFVAVVWPALNGQRGVPDPAQGVG
ncbi:MAG TPA: hypothetical protein VHB47_06015, partial [Thermoanaerobaculia bacterium]|nr:hypothetical protein [Thermoanaerobaculia bacterium]